MKRLHLADHLLLPADEAVTQKYGFIGRSGSGKSYGSMKMAELFLDAGAQIIALDWVGIWWSLRLAANGKDPGFEHVYIFGGEHHDVDLRTRSPQKPSELAAGLKVSNFIVNARLKALEKRGTVKLTGATFSRQAHLIDGKAPKPNGSMKPSPASAIDVVEARDRQVLGKIREAGPNGRSLRELGILTGETEASLSSALTRLRVKKQISADDNGKWVSA